MPRQRSTLRLKLQAIRTRAQNEAGLSPRRATAQSERSRKVPLDDRNACAQIQLGRLMGPQRDAATMRVARNDLPRGTNMKYFAAGRVMPERVAVNFQPTQIEFGRGLAEVACDSSQLSIRIEIDGETDLGSAHATSDYLVNMVVGALGYSLGCGYYAEITQVIPETGPAAVFGVRPVPDLEFPNYEREFRAALDLSGRNVFFRMAIRDYMQALTDAHDCAFYCYRAIEAIQNSFAAPPGSNGWDRMHAALGTTRGQIDDIVKVYADPNRHGNWAESKPTTGAERARMLTLLRDILNRMTQLPGLAATVLAERG